MDAVTALTELEAAAGDGRLDELCDRFGLDLVGAFGSATRPAEVRLSDPRDLDVAVRFADSAEPDLIGLVNALVELCGYDGIDVMVLNRADPVAAARGLVGVPLYERSHGQYAEAQMRALAMERDTRWMRELSLRTMAR